MSPRRITLFIAVCLLMFLGIYTWNQRTGHLDIVGANSGLEITGVTAKVFAGVGDSVSGVVNRYIDLINVRAENDRLNAQIRNMEMELFYAEEDRAELERLRHLLALDYPSRWPAMGARVLAGRMGPNAGLETLMLSRGYLTGARPGTPLITSRGLVGRVLKSGPSTSTALLITDPGSRVAVVSSEGRVQGILAGGGAGALLQMRFVRQNSSVDPGELLVTSGVDAAYPKGIPVARVISFSEATQEIYAEPMADFAHLEEVLLLERPEGWFAPEPAPVYTSQPLHITGDGLTLPLEEDRPVFPLIEDAEKADAGSETGGEVTGGVMTDGNGEAAQGLADEAVEQGVAGAGA